MLDKFWESLGEDLAGEWLKHVFSPAFLFWAGGLGMYALQYSSLFLWKWYTGLQLFQQTSLLILTLLVLILSSLLMQRLRFNILRLLEGYWPWPFGGLANRLADLQNLFFDRREKRWNNLKSREKTLTFSETRKMAELDLNNHYYPTNPKNVQPTALGNILRFAETTSIDKYGLDAFICWPRLWLLLPDNAREDLSAARQGLMTFVELWAWGLLFLVWSRWSLWAIPIAAVWLWLAYAMILQAAMAYADLLEAAFDLYRWELYKAAHWPLPDVSGEAETASGQRLTEFLWRGEAGSAIQYDLEKEQ